MKTKTPPDLTERRYITLEVRADSDEPRIVGYAAKFNRDSQPLGWSGFIERIAPGAFAKTIKEADIRALGNHDPNVVLGRNKAGTLSLSEDKTGLRYDIDIDADNSQSMSWYRMVKRGDISQSSFGFQVVKDEWTYPDDDNEPIVRTLKEVKLFDVSPVTFPAYLDTEAEARKAFRSLAEATGRDLDEVVDLVRTGEARTLAGNGGEPPSTPPADPPAVEEPDPESTPDENRGAAESTPTDLLLRAFLPPDGVEDLEEKYGVTHGNTDP